MMLARIFKLLFFHFSIVFDKEVRNEKDLEKFIIHYLKNTSRHREATVKTIFKTLNDSGLLNSAYKLSERRIGRSVLSDRVGLNAENIMTLKLNKNSDSGGMKL
jgi:hypothetical protein